MPTYPVSIENLAPRRVAALEHRGDYQQIGGTFERLSKWAGSHGVLGPDTKLYGIYYDDPESTPKEKLRADACVTFPESTSADGDVRITKTPGGRCAVLEHTGPYSSLPDAWKWLYAVWLPKNGEKESGKPAFVEYLNDPSQVEAAKLRTNVCVPLE